MEGQDARLPDLEEDSDFSDDEEEWEMSEEDLLLLPQKRKRKRTKERNKKKRGNRRANQKKRAAAQIAFLQHQHPAAVVTLKNTDHNPSPSETRTPQQKRRIRKRYKRHGRQVFINNLDALNGTKFIIDEDILNVPIRRPYERKKYETNRIYTAKILKQSVDGQPARIFENGVTLLIRQGDELVLGLSACVQPANVMAVAADGVIVLKEIRRFHLPQKRHTTVEEGWVGGGGYRRGYVRGEDWGFYRTKNRNTPEADGTYRYYFGNIMVLVEALEEYCKDTFPQVYEERVTFIQINQLDSITRLSPHFIFSHNFRGAPHFDLDIGYAIGLWLLHHEPHCPHKDERCAPHWYFYLSQHHIAIKLQHGTVIVWNSHDVAHCTIHDPVLPKDTGGCNVTALCIVTQIQRTYAAAVIRVNSQKN